MNVTALGAEDNHNHIICRNQKRLSRRAGNSPCGNNVKEEEMLKIRLQGTPKDILWFKKILERDKRIHLIEFSDMFSNKGTNKYFRVYAEVEKSETARNRERINKETKRERRARLGIEDESYY